LKYIATSEKSYWQLWTCANCTNKIW